MVRTDIVCGTSFLAISLTVALVVIVGLTPDVRNVIGFMNLFGKATGMSRNLMYDYVPAYIFDRLNQ
mgnify:CR=1 FL=1